MRICFFFIPYLLTETFAGPTVLPLPPKDVIVNINTRKWIHLLNDKFLSFTLQPHIALEFQDYRLDSHPATLNMFKALSPGMLRLGGPETNDITFLTPGKNSEYTITEEQWKRINEFCQNTKLDLIVCVNPMERVHEVWQSRGALEFIYASDKLGYELRWQLGYELQRLTNNSEPLSGSELGRDVVRMRKILDSFPRYSKSSIIGPDVIASSTAQEIKFIKEYINESGDALTALTWHPNFSAEEREMEDVSHTLSQIQHQLENVIWARDLKNPFMKPVSKKEVWLSESDPDEYTGKFTDALTWAKRLGTAAMLGFPVLMKQITTNSVSQPTPDFWVSVLYKSLVGRAVLETKLLTGDKNTSPVFAHCTEMSQNNIIDGDIQYERGAITIFGLNLAKEDMRLNIKASLKEESVHMYFLTSRSNNNNSEETYMNGQLLSLSPTGEVPILLPKVKSATRNILVDVPPHSVFFVVLPDTKVRPCTLYPSSQAGSIKINSVNQGNGFTSNINSSNKNGDGEEDIFVRFGPKKKNVTSNPGGVSKNELGIEKLSKLNSPKPDFDNGEGKGDLDRSAKSIKEANVGSLPKNKFQKTPVKDNLLKLSDKLRTAKKEGQKSSKMNENDEIEANEKDKELSEAMLKTKFILFSDDDWMSNFSHAKKAVEAAKKIIEAFDEAEMIKKKDSPEQKILQLENDKYHVQYGKEALRKKKFAVLTASVVDKQNDTAHTVEETDEVVSDPEKSLSDNFKQKNKSESIDNLGKNNLEKETQRRRRHIADDTYPIGEDMITDLFLAAELMPHILQKRKHDHPYADQYSQRNIKTSIDKENSRNMIMKEINPSSSYYDKTVGNLRDTMPANSEEDIFPTQNIYLKDFADLTESNEKYNEDMFEIQEQEESDDSVGEQVDNGNTYYPGEFFEFNMQGKMPSGDNLHRFEELSEAEVIKPNENHDIKPDKDAPNLLIVKEDCKNADHDKEVKEKVEKQLDKYYENAESTIKFTKQLDDLGETNQNEDKVLGTLSDSDKKIENNNEKSTINSKPLDKRIKRSAIVIKSKINERTDYNDKNGKKLSGSKLVTGKKDESHSRIIKEVSRGSKMPKQVINSKIGISGNKHVSKREIKIVHPDGSELISENLKSSTEEAKTSFSEPDHILLKNNMTDDLLTKKENEVKPPAALTEKQTVSEIGQEKEKPTGSSGATVKPTIVVMKNVVRRSDFDSKVDNIKNKSDIVPENLLNNVSKNGDKKDENLEEEDKNKQSGLIKASIINQKISEKSEQNFNDNVNSSVKNSPNQINKDNMQNLPTNIDSNMGLTGFKPHDQKDNLPLKNSSNSVSIIDGDLFSTNLSMDNTKEDVLESEYKNEKKNDVDIVCGRTKNFGTFCIGSERKIDQSNEKSLKDDSEMALSDKNLMKKPYVKLEEDDSSNTKIKNDLLNSSPGENYFEEKPEVLRRREVMSDSGMMLSYDSNLDRDIGQEYLEEGTPMCKASRSAPYVEDFEELLSQIQGLDRNLENPRQRRLIRFSLPAMNADLDSNLNSNYSEGKEKQNTDDNLMNSESNNRHLVKINNDQRMNIGKQIKGTIIRLPLKKENNQRNRYDSGIQSESNKYHADEDDDDEKMLEPGKIMMVPIRNFRNKGNMMMGGYDYDDSFTPKEFKRRNEKDENDFYSELNEKNQFSQRMRSQQARGYYPYASVYKNINNKDKKGQNRSNEKNLEFASLSSSKTKQMDGMKFSKDNEKSAVIKDEPINLMPIMLMSPDMFEMFKSKYASRTNSHRSRRSLVPYFHNFKNDVANMKNEMMQSLPSQLNNDRIYPRSPSIKNHYPVNFNIDNYMNNNSPSQMHMNRVIKETHYRKRSARDVSNSISEKEKFMKDINDEKHNINELAKEIDKDADDWKDEEAFDTNLMNDKNRLINSLSTRLADLTKVYAQERSKNKEDSKNNNNFKESSQNGNKIKTFTYMNNSHKNLATKEQENSSDSLEKNKSKAPGDNSVTINSNSNLKKELNNASNILQQNQISFNYVVNQMKELVNIIMNNLTLFN